jgi:thiamine pyrophosphate-dependent acetolactate synthase large subunit-like protein
MTEQSTVRSVTFDLLRSLRLTTVFGNPGSTEEPFLQEFPDDFSYVLALQEETPGFPGLDLPGLGIAAMARGFGCRAVDVATAEELEQEFKTALSADTTTVIVVPTQPQKAML